MASSPLERRVAVVTGSGKKRIGWDVANALADRGYQLVIHYDTSAADAADTVDRLNTRGIEAVALQADVGDESAVRNLISGALDRFGRLDALVNCAAVYEPKKLEDVTAADVLHNFETNLLGTFLCAQQAGLAMVRQPDGGCIVNFGDWALVRPYLNYAAYFASKGAIPTLTRCLAVEFGTRNPLVRVNCIQPGPILFPENMPDAERQSAISSTLLKRAGQPDNVTAAVLFLLENDYVTGVCLAVDGGRSIYATGS